MAADSSAAALTPEEISNMPNRKASTGEGRQSASVACERQPMTDVKKTTQAQTESIEDVAEAMAREKDVVAVG